VGAGVYRTVAESVGPKGTTPRLEVALSAHLSFLIVVEIVCRGPYTIYHHVAPPPACGIDMDVDGTPLYVQ
jgi:hypothetical protein